MCPNDPHKGVTVRVFSDKTETINDYFNVLNITEYPVPTKLYRITKMAILRFQRNML